MTRELDSLLEQKLRGLDSGNSSLESGDRSFDSADQHHRKVGSSFESSPPPSDNKSKNRLSSTSSKDSGHKSDSIDRSTTNSSKSDSSQLSLKSEPATHSTAAGSPKPNSKPTTANSDLPPRLRQSQSMFSIDEDFVFVNSKQGGGSVDFNRNSTSIKPAAVAVNSTVDPSSKPSRRLIDPIYEMIAESESDDMYCLPADNLDTNDVGVTNHTNSMAVHKKRLTNAKPVVNSTKPVFPKTNPAMMSSTNPGVPHHKPVMPGTNPVMSRPVSSPEHRNGKTRSKSSDKIKDLIRNKTG